MGPQDFLVIHHDCKDYQQKTLHKYAINQVLHCELEQQAVESTDVIAKLYSKDRATIHTSDNFTGKFFGKKKHCSQVSNGNKNRLNLASCYQSNIERLIYLIPEDCKNELKRLKILTKTIILEQ